MSQATMLGNLAGIVSSYDSAAGLGEVESSSGVSYVFQCTQIANGSREVPVGAKVIFDMIVAGPGSWEAGNLVVLAE